MTVLQLDHVSRQYAAAAGTATISVLDDVNLSVQKGDALAIVGPSGCGKSTLLHLMGALDQPDSGRVILEGCDLAQLNDGKRAKLRNERIGFIFQAHHLLPQCTVIENVLVPTLVGGATAADRERAEALLERVGLAERRNHRPACLSGGECQRVAVVRALINQPSLLLADEPTGSLDHTNAAMLVELLAELNQQQQVALVMVTHAIDLASKLDTVYELREGRLQPRRGVS